MKKRHFFSFSLRHLSRVERWAWGILVVVVMGFNIFTTQLEALADQVNGELPVTQPAMEEEIAQPMSREWQVLPENTVRKPRKIYTSTLTSYTSLPGLTDASPFITANGSHVHDGTIAANCLAFGTKVQFPELYGDKIFVVEDRLHPRKGCQVIDVWLPDYNSAVQFGVKYTAVHVL